MPTSFLETSPAYPQLRAQEPREIRERRIESNDEQSGREFHWMDAYGTISPRTAAHASSELLAQASRSLRFHRFGEERDMPVLINNYLGICCRHECLRNKMLFIKERHPEAVIDIAGSTITVGNDRFIFLVNPENDHDRLMGIELTAYRTCSHYVLSAELRGRLATRIRQR